MLITNSKTANNSSIAFASLALNTVLLKLMMPHVWSMMQSGGVDTQAVTHGLHEES